jgi:hypothetical protein
MAVFGSNIVPQLAYDGRAVGDRNEDWRGAIARLRERYPQHPAPIMLEANLVEDSDNFYQEEGESDAHWEARLAEQKEYRCFPLRSQYETGIPADAISPWSLYEEVRDHHWPEPTLARSQHEFWLVSRDKNRIPVYVTRSKDLMLLTMTVEEHYEFNGVYVSRLAYRREPGTPTSTQSQSSGP